MVSFIKPSAAANMKQYLMPSYGEIMKHALTCKAIGAEVCSSVWCEFVLVKVNMNQLGVILYLNMYVCKFEPIQHVFRQKAFCKESILFHSYTLFYSLQRGQGIFIAINYTHVFSGDPKLACDALQEMRVAHRWDAIQEDTDAREEARCSGEAYNPIVLANGDSHKQLLARSRYLLFKSADKRTDSQKQRAELLFEACPDLKEAYSLTHSLRMIFSRNTAKDAARLSLARWYNEVDGSGFKSFNVIAGTLYEHYDEVLNFFVNRATNAFAESFNAKIKAFRASLRGVTDIRFFLFRLTRLYA